MSDIRTAESKNSKYANYVVQRLLSSYGPARRTRLFSFSTCFSILAVLNWSTTVFWTGGTWAIFLLGGRPRLLLVVAPDATFSSPPADAEFMITVFLGLPLFPLGAEDAGVSFTLAAAADGTTISTASKSPSFPSRLGLFAKYASL